jgi:hypothetical protein
MKLISAEHLLTLLIAIYAQEPAKSQVFSPQLSTIKCNGKGDIQFVAPPNGTTVMDLNKTISMQIIGGWCTSRLDQRIYQGASLDKKLERTSELIMECVASVGYGASLSDGNRVIQGNTIEFITANLGKLLYEIQKLEK